MIFVSVLTIISLINNEQLVECLISQLDDSPSLLSILYKDLKVPTERLTDIIFSQMQTGKDIISVIEDENLLTSDIVLKAIQKQMDNFVVFKFAFNIKNIPGFGFWLKII